MKMTLKEYRKYFGIAVKEASVICNTPLRTYVRYESDDNYGDKLKRAQMIILLKEKCEITEDQGLLTLEQIKDICAKTFSNYGDDILFCYLFGSYAKGYATQTSDVDLFISTTLSGLDFVGLIEELRVALHKRVDLIRLHDICDNIELLNEILKDGKKIYE